VLKLVFSIEGGVVVNVEPNSFGGGTAISACSSETLRFLYHQYSKMSVTQAITIPTKMTIKTPPGDTEMRGQPLSQSVWLYELKSLYQCYEY